MSFAERQDFHLVETLEDINRTLYRDWSYQSGTTTLSTTPWEVYVTRRGVCQDFANLMICLARLLGIPARYRVGYLFTGGRGGDAAGDGVGAGVSAVGAGGSRPADSASSRSAGLETPGTPSTSGRAASDQARRRQSEASHAWVELYLPHAGWRGFDPTNGCLAGRQHVRVACGRNFRDATPTAGTLYRGGGRETLEIEVLVERAEVLSSVAGTR